MNNFIGIGKINGDPNISYTQDGKAIARISLAINNFKEDGSVAGSDFIPVTAFGKAAEAIEKQAHKDDTFMIEGAIQTGSYTDRNGQKVYTTDIIARHARAVADANLTLNRVSLMGRLTRDPYITNGETATARFTLAVDRRFKTDTQDTADFISCVLFGKTAEFAEKYLRRGTKIALEGYFHTGSYTDKSGQKVYTKDVLGTNIEFAESKNAAGTSTGAPANTGMARPSAAPTDFGFMNVPAGIDEELPFM